MKTRALILCLSLLFAVSCSKKKTKINPSLKTDEAVVEGTSTKDDTQAAIDQESLDEERNEELDYVETEEREAIILPVDTSIKAPVLTEGLATQKERLSVPEINDEAMTTQERVAQGEPPAEVILHSEEGIAYVDPHWESAWLDTYAKGGTARTIVLEDRDMISDELSEALLVRTNTTPEVVTVELKASRLLKKMQMTFDEYIDYLAWKSDDCTEAFDSIYSFAQKYGFQVNRSYFTYDANCNCQKLDQKYSVEVLELFRYQRSSGWECPDNYITFKTCMDPTGEINKYETIKLNFKNAKQLTEGDYELYRVRVKQKRLGSKKLEFEVTPLESNKSTQLESEYEVKKGGLFKNRNSVSIKGK